MEIDDIGLASLAATDIDTVRTLMELGILPGEGPFDRSLVPRVRFLVQLRDAGVPLDALAKAVAEGELSVTNIEETLPGAVAMLDAPLGEIAARLGVSVSFLEAVQLALGVDASDDQAYVREDDLEIMNTLAGLVALEIDEDVALRLFEIMADDMRRTSRAVSEMWQAGIQQPMIDSGASYSEVLGARSGDADTFLHLGESVVRLLWNRFLEEEIFRGTIVTLTRALEERGRHSTGTAHPPAVVFMDLTGFTHRTGERGDEAAAMEARNLVDLIRRQTVRRGGTLVKMLGDGAMLYFADPAAAVRCCLALAAEIAKTDLPPGRFAVNAGPLIIRDVDYYGQTVNVAARLVDYARPGEVLAGEAVVDAAAREDDLRFEEIGPVSLKGVDSLVTVYSARAEPMP
jgi:adenylate cyclase